MLLSQENGDVVFKGLNVAIRVGSAVRGSFQMRDAVYTKADEEDLTRTDARAHTRVATHARTHSRAFKKNMTQPLSEAQPGKMSLSECVGEDGE